MRIYYLHLFPAAKKMVTVCALLLLCGCKTRTITVEKPVVVEHTTTNNAVQVVRDTVMQRDSVYHYIHGDTVRIERWNTLYNHSVTHDTVVQVEQVPMPYEVKVTEYREVERKARWWQTALQWCGGVALIALIAAAWFTIKRIRR